MKYADLKNCMAEYRAGNIEREDMVAAISLWQRPVEVTQEILKNAKKRYDVANNGYFHDQKGIDNYWIANKRAKAAIEAVIR